jgi:peroxiredoxin Q/BCP
MFCRCPSRRRTVSLPFRSSSRISINHLVGDRKLAELGTSAELADYAGRNLVLYFYLRDDTLGCTKEAQAFTKLGSKLEKHDVVVLGCSPDTPESHREFIAKYKLKLDLLSDPDTRVMTRYGAFGEKMMYGKNTTGVIRSSVWIGPDGKAAKHWARVAKVEDHPAKVLEAIEQG